MDTIVKEMLDARGLPKIAVPVMKETEEEIVSFASAAEGAADLLEIRADAFADLMDGDALAHMLAAVRSAVRIPLLITVRTAAEGGLFQGSDEAYGAVLRQILASQAADLIDIEAAREGAGALLEEAHSLGIPVVMSNHDFHRTPSKEEIFEIFARMEEMGADILKGAYMPLSHQDVTNLLLASSEAKRRFKASHVLISMGEMGAASRICAEAFSSVLTFAALGGEGSAPGQLDAVTLRGLLAGEHERLRNPSLYLIGFMGTGKSSVGAALARMTGRPLVEMDAVIEQEAGRTIPEIFASEGEQGFRDRESALVNRIAGERAQIVSCGGGAVLRGDNVVEMKKSGRIVLLTASPERLLARLSPEAEHRPKLRGRLSEEGIAGLLEERREAYEAAADCVLATDDLTPEQIASALAEAFFSK